MLLSFSACASTEDVGVEPLPEPTEPEADAGKAEEALIALLEDGDMMGECDLEWEKNWVDEETPFTVDQMVSCREYFDVSLNLISSENGGDWAGLGIRQTAGLHAKFFEIPDEGFNPVNLYQTEEALVLDTASEDGTLQRYTYAYAGVTEENLHTWTKDKCTGTYDEASYVAETACTASVTQ